MPKTNKQRERARRRRKGEAVVVSATNIGRRQATHMRQSTKVERARFTTEAQHKSRRSR